MPEPNRVLIVDDDAALRTTLGDILQLKGFEPVPAETGRQALEEANRQAPSVAVIDLQLEDMSGIEVLRRLRQCAPETECILLTGHASQDSAIKAINLGAYSYIKKPYDAEQLLLCIRRAGEKRQVVEQLRQSQKLEAVGRLAGGVAHDFNNLLSVILGYSEIVLENLPPDHCAHELVGRIYRAGINARELTRQLLAFSRKQVLEMKAVDLNAVVRGFEKLLARVIGEDIRLRLVLCAEPIFVKADTSQLEQVLMNLGVNARDAMPEGGVLTIETSTVRLGEQYARSGQGMPSGAYARICVSDTGCGIDQLTMGLIFEPFFTTKAKDKGTGLGLATSYGIIKQHGGNILVYSEPGKGATFKIYLPLVEAQSGLKPLAAATPEVMGGTETILLVEDNEEVRLLTSAILKRQGYTVLAAENGQAALEIMGDYEGLVQLLLTDLVMPGMSGRELNDRLTVRFPDLRVLFMSGYSDDVISHFGVADPGVNFIQKPFEVQALATKVRQVLAGDDHQN